MKFTYFNQNIIYTIRLHGAMVFPIDAKKVHVIDNCATKHGLNIVPTTSSYLKHMYLEYLAAPLIKHHLAIPTTYMTATPTIKGPH